MHERYIIIKRFYQGCEISDFTRNSDFFPQTPIYIFRVFFFPSRIEIPKSETRASEKR